MTGGFHEIMQITCVTVTHSPWCSIERGAPRCPECGSALRVSVIGANPWLPGKCNFACRRSDAEDAPCDCETAKGAS